MANILLLPDNVINQIAAGEVIEDPASAIKELLENSLDAKAKKIVVSIAFGGLQSIIIEDDGSGMSEEDAHLSIQRHATSKIRTFSDLQTIHTMGFRGEALASISSISSMEIRTCVQGANRGFLLKWDYGKKIEEKPIARTPGTTISVRSLFYNVPARKKFQKSAQANTTAISRTMQRIALSHPDISFTLISHDKELLHCEPESQTERIISILGNDFIEKMRPFSWKEEELSLKGFIGIPSEAKSHRLGQYLYLNQRPIQSPLITQAIREGYGTYLGEKMHPLFFLHMEIPQNSVDINVHPQKKLVRLHNEHILKEKIIQAIAKGLQKPQKALSFNSSVEFSQQQTFTAPSFLLRKEMPQEEEFSLPTLVEPIALFDEYLLFLAAQIANQWQWKDRTGFVLFDLSAIYARLLFEPFQSLLIEKASHFAQQRLLFPLTIDLSNEEMAALQLHRNELEKIGITVRTIGDKTIAIDSLPVGFEADIFSELFIRVLTDLTGKETMVQQREKKLAQTISSFARRRKQYTIEEAKKLYESLLGCKQSTLCPLGRPLWKHFTKNQLEKFFQTSR